MDDPPPIHFECDSFLFTSPATSPEWFVLHPVTGTLSLYDNVLEVALRGHGFVQDRTATNNLDRENTLLHPNSSTATNQTNTNTVNTTTSSNLKNKDRLINHKDGDDDDHFKDTPIPPLRPPPRPIQQFLSGADSQDNLPLEEYAPFLSPRTRTRSWSSSNNHSNDLSMEICHLGTECKTTLRVPSTTTFTTATTTTTTTASPMIMGTMVSLGRSFHSIEPENAHDDEEDADDDGITEILTWYRPTPATPTMTTDPPLNERLFADRRVCRIRSGTIWTMELCAFHKRLYITFAAARPHHPPRRPPLEENHNQNDHDEHDNDDHDDTTLHHCGSSHVHALPLIPYPESLEQRTTPETYFPSPDFVLDCSLAMPNGNHGHDYDTVMEPQNVVSLAATPCGRELLVGTQQGTLQVWHVATEYPSPSGCATTTTTRPVLKQCIQITTAIADARRKRRPQKTFTSADPSDTDNRAIPDPNATATTSTTSRRIEEEEEDADHLLFLNAMRAPIEAIRVASHLDPHRAGFVTLQYNPRTGGTLLLWKLTRNEQTKKEEYQLQSLINLPLMTEREPKVQFDGRRIVVFGQDHIGYIILVYQVLYSMEDADWFVSSPRHRRPPVKAKHSTRRQQLRRNSPPLREDDGGVVNMVYEPGRPPPLRFANHIRHAALGGLASYESIHMSLNERFIMVNTKTGNLLPTSHSIPYSEGLLIIDLDDNNYDD